MEKVDFEFRPTLTSAPQVYSVSREELERAQDQARRELGTLYHFYNLRVAHLLGISITEGQERILCQQLPPDELTYASELGLSSGEAKEAYLGGKLQLLGKVLDKTLASKTSFELRQGDLVEVRGHYMVVERPFRVSRKGQFGNQASRTGGYWLRKTGSECSLKATYSTLLQALEIPVESIGKDIPREKVGIRSFKLIR